jgi:hypothetical protein
VRAAIAEATAEVLDPPHLHDQPEVVRTPKPSPTKGKAGAGKGRASPGKGKVSVAKATKQGKRRRAAATPPPAVNEPLAFLMFVAANPIGTEVAGTVASYTSHGAMVEVELPEGSSLHCYVPLAGLGDPPPTRARQVLARGEQRRFVLVGLDPLRRVAELTLPESVDSPKVAGCAWTRPISSRTVSLSSSSTRW